MDTTFSFQLRILLCTHCGAPLEASPAGGQIPCRYCHAVNQLSVRDDRPAFAPTQAPISEQERLGRLRAQDGKPLLPPASLQALVPNGQLPAWKVQEALAVWQATRQELRVTANFEAAERLLFLTMILSQHFVDQTDRLRQRAMLESALEVFTLPRHRQVMRGFLCRSACRLGDLQAAEQWLAPCDRLSDDLETDSEYRYSRAFLDTARGDWNAVLRTLGGRFEDVPIQDAMDAACSVLRANAWERLGQVQSAVGLLQQAMAQQGASGRQAISKVIALNAGMRLCEQSHPLAASQHAVVAGQAAAAAVSGGIHKPFFVIGVVCLLASSVCIVLMLTDLIFDAPSGAAFGCGIALVTLLPMGLIFGGIGYAMGKAAAKAERLQAHGIVGTGQVLGAQPTGMAINHVPQMAIRLQIALPGRPPYEATTKMLMSANVAHALVPGAMVSVRVDPDQPSDVLIEAQ
jgi:hypothetical protein